MNVGESLHFVGLAATTDPFTLKGGRYLMAVDIGAATSVTLEALVGAVWLDALPSKQVAVIAEGDGGGNLDLAFTADGVRTFDACPATYRIALVGDPATHVSIARVPAGGN